MQIELINDDYSCPNCYYEMFDETAFPCSRCIHNMPKDNMFQPKVAEQTEPQTCEWCKFFDGENCYSQEPCKAKTEPQTERYCTNCKHNGVIEDYECRECHGMDKHEFIEPQTELTAKCLDCINARACKEHHWEGCRYESRSEWDEPQTEREGE